MKFTPSITLGLLLSLTANAAPFEKERKVHIESKRVVDALTKRDKSCYTNGGKNCRWDPYLNAEIITTTSAQHYNYLCWQEGDCFDGNCTWDWNDDLGCFVNGYFTDNNCSPSTLPRCSFYKRDEKLSKE